MTHIDASREIKLQKSLREDGRTSLLQMRDIKCLFNIAHGATGSARFKFGNTSVLTLIYGPDGAQTTKKQKFIDRGTFDVNVQNSCCVNSKASNYIRSCVVFLSKALICFEDLRGTHIKVVLYLEEDDGSLLSCALNSVTCAIIAAGIPSRSLILSVTLQFGLLNAFHVEGNQELILVDPALSELQANECHLGSNRFSSQMTYSINILQNELFQVFPEHKLSLNKFRNQQNLSSSRGMDIGCLCCQYIAHKIRDQIQAQLVEPFNTLLALV